MASGGGQRAESQEFTAVSRRPKPATHDADTTGAIVGGIAGATVSRCVEGYGAGGQLHTTRLLELSENLPVRIEIIDVRERIDPLLTALADMVGEGLVVLDDVHILRFLTDPKK